MEDKEKKKKALKSPLPYLLNLQIPGSILKSSRQEPLLRPHEFRTFI